MKGFKQMGAIALAALTMLHGTAFAQAIAIKDISVSGNKVTVEAVNQGENETIFSVSVVKKDGTLHRNNATRTVRQQKVAAGEEIKVTFSIPEEKNGVDGSGTYIVKVHSKEGDKTQEEFTYADFGDVTAFINLLKEEDAKVSESNPAEALLLPVVTAEENKGALFSLGVDRDTFTGKSLAIQQDAMKLLHQNGLADMTADTFASVLQTAFGLASFNNGEEKEGIAIMKPVYAGKEADAALLDGTISLMAERYETTQAFVTAFKTSYGLTLIHNADTSTMSDALKGFRDETSLCVDEVNKIEGLTSTQKYEAYRYLVQRLDSNKAETAGELATALTEAYDHVKDSGTGSGNNSGGSFGGGGGGGGGAVGSAGNKDVLDGGSVSVPQGSGTADTKNEEVRIFTDLTDFHWAATSIRWLKSKGVVGGTDTGAFEPDRSVTREEFTKMIVLACEFALSGNASFADAAVDGWYLPYLGTAVDNGVVSGMGDGRFGIGMNITRQDMVVMVARALAAKGVTLAKVKDYQAFVDEDAIADYAKDAVKALFEAGIVNGKGASTFDPMGQATRAEAAKIIYEACKEV